MPGAKTRRDEIIGYLGEAYEAALDGPIDDYCEVERILVRIKAEIANSPLMVEYTNKAGATNTIKNPLIAEVPRYVQTLNALRKVLGLTAAQLRRTGSADDEDDLEV